MLCIRSSKGVTLEAAHKLIQEIADEYDKGLIGKAELKEKTRSGIQSLTPHQKAISSTSGAANSSTATPTVTPTSKAPPPKKAKIHDDKKDFLFFVPVKCVYICINMNNIIYICCHRPGPVITIVNVLSVTVMLYLYYSV